jgi:hypothetical protein
MGGAELKYNQMSRCLLFYWRDMFDIKFVLLTAEGP